MATPVLPRSAPWRRPALLTLLAALALSGCGSTALRGNAAAGGSTGVVTSDTTGGDQQGTGGAGGATSGVTSGTTGTAGSAGSTGSSGGATGSSGTGAAGGSTTGGQKTACSKPIRVGETQANLAAIAAAFGKPDPTPKNTQNPFIAYINKHGGVGCRKLVEVIYTADSSSDANTAAQAACATFTQDNKVDVVLDGVIGGDILPACLQRKGIASFTAANTSPDSVAMAAHPNEFNPSSMYVDRQIRALLQVSAQRKALKAGNKLGVMVENCPTYVRTYNNVVVPMAKQLGVSVVQSSIKCVTNLVEDLGPVSSDIQRAALTFSSSGVSHVMAVANVEAFAIANFTTNAHQQKYFPKYLVTSNTYPWNNSQSDSTVKISDDALPNMSGVGYIPLLDVGPNARPTPAQKARQAMCTKIDPTQGGADQSNPPSNKPFRQSVFYTGCDMVFSMKDVVEAAALNFDYRALSKAYYALKQSGQVSADLNNGVIGGPASATDGAGYVQPFAYDTSRKTFAYVGPSVAVS